jgi:hypothetical protein
MSFLVVELAVSRGRVRSACFRRTVGRNVLMAAADFGPGGATLMAGMLRQREERKRETNYQQSKQFFHGVVTILR